MPKIALLFPGQGAQTVGMGKGLVEATPELTEFFNRANQVLGYDLQSICFDGPAEKLNETRFSQPALFVHSMAAYEQLKRQMPEVESSTIAAAGLSLGEYSALCAIGALSFEDGLRLVQRRGEAMQTAAEKISSGMASVLGLTLEQVEELCHQARIEGEILQVANLLCPGNIAISGQTASLDRVEPIALEMGAMKVIRLAVAGAFHTPIMEPAVAELEIALQQTPLTNARCPLFSNVDANPHQTAADFAPLLARQVVSPVLWEQSLRNLIDLGIDQFYEIGAGRVLAGTLKRIDRKIACQNVGD